MSSIQDLMVEVAFPQFAMCHPSDDDLDMNADVMRKLASGEAYKECHNLLLNAGSQVEGLALKNNWGHPSADTDLMLLEGHRLGVFVPGGNHARGQSCLTYCFDGCSAAYTKLAISDLNSLSEVGWWRDSCVETVSGRQWLSTYHLMRIIAEEEVISGPAVRVGLSEDVSSLVASAPHPELQQEFLHRPRGKWPPKASIDYIVQLPMLLVLVGHTASLESKLQARLSWSHCESHLMKDLPLIAKQGFIASKYVLKRFLAARRGPAGDGDGRSKVGSYHIKTVFLYFLEKVPPWDITSPFDLFLALLRALDGYLKIGRLPHYFLSHCDLLETVDGKERGMARQVIQEIELDPWAALLTSPTNPSQVYGEVLPNDLLITFRRAASQSICGQSRQHLTELLSSLDKWRQQRYHDLVNRYCKPGSGQTNISGLVDTLSHC